MTNLKASVITISDSIGQLSTDCHLELVSVAQNSGFPYEFSLPGDSATLVASDIRPTGDRVTVNISYGNTPSFPVFSGITEHLDDLNDPDQYLYNVDLSNLPQGNPQRNQISAIYNQVTPLNGYTDSTAYAIIQDVCAKAGLAIGRIDMPDYNVWGNFEVIRENPINVATKLCDPFNKFDFFKYIVRCDNNGLSIIGVDYTQGAQVSNVHSITKIKHHKRSFSVYKPEQKIGASDVLISGGDIYGNQGAYTLTGYCWKIFTDSSRDTQSSGSTNGFSEIPIPSPILTNWVETETYMIFLVDLTINEPNDPRIVSGFTFQDTYDANVNMLTHGVIDNLKIRNQYVMYKKVKSYTDTGAGSGPNAAFDRATGADNGGGLTSITITSYQYSNFIFNSGVPGNIGNNNQSFQCIAGISTYNIPKIAPVYSSTTKYTYPNGIKFPISLTKTWYKYEATGAINYQVQANYFSDLQGSWILQNVIQPDTNQQEITSALVEFYNNIRNITPTAFNSANPLLSTTQQGAKTDIGKYQIRNGLTVAPVQLQRQPCILNQQSERLKDFVINNAFQMDGPYMDYNGLTLLWALAQREIQLEQQNAYWDIMEIECPIDTGAYIGESIITEGTGGIVDSFTHTINADEGVSSIKIRRIIIPTTQNLQIPVSLAGTYPAGAYPAYAWPVSAPQAFTVDKILGTSPVNFNAFVDGA